MERPAQDRGGFVRSAVRRMSTGRVMQAAVLATAIFVLARAPHAAGQVGVLLANDDHATFELQQQLMIHLNAGQISKAAFVNIPPQSRWVIEYVSMHATLPPSQSFVPHINFQAANDSTDGPFLQHNLPAESKGVFRGGTVAFWHTSEQVRIYADNPNVSSVLQNNSLQVQVERSASAGTADFQWTLSGYVTQKP